MSEAKHTPGPWKLEEGTGYHTGTYVITGGGLNNPSSPLARLSDFDSACIYDAKLIAAAPDLLSALERLVSLCDPEISGSVGSALEQARAAIAKATS